ncbi:MAG TPA: cytochrome B5 [Clostridiales bacterium]|nr:cytochrome B5 [Clostridiales bacterium]
MVILLAVIAASACSGAAATTNTAATGNATERSFTIDELAQYDGLEGRKAYIAVDGVVYDVTDIAQWKDGLHQGKFQAGKDYSDEIRSESPHGLSMLSRADKVGILAD